MKVIIYNVRGVVLANVELEVVPRGIYEIDGTEYETVGSPKFRIERNVLQSVELIVKRFSNYD